MFCFIEKVEKSPIYITNPMLCKSIALEHLYSECGPTERDEMNVPEVIDPTAEKEGALYEEPLQP